LYESTGLNGKSALRKVNIKSGKVLQEFKLDQNYFAEGITIHANKIYQLTWQNNIVFVYDLLNFKLLNNFSYQGEGWGITNDTYQKPTSIYFISFQNLLNAVFPHDLWIVLIPIMEI
jgi:glutamine cyclotransferase